MNPTIFPLLGLLLAINLSSVLGYNSETSTHQYEYSEVTTINPIMLLADLDTGCTLEVPETVKKQKEAMGKPLRILIHVTVLGVRDIPDSGGSFGVDIM